VQDLIKVAQLQQVDRAVVQELLVALALVILLLLLLLRDSQVVLQQIALIPRQAQAVVVLAHSVAIAQVCRPVVRLKQ
jgi:hypothetical protein